VSNQKDCACDKCVKACHRTPGWFMPGEAQKAAKLMGMSFREFRDRYLVREFWGGYEGLTIWCPLKTVTLAAIGLKESTVNAMKAAGIEVQAKAGSWAPFSYAFAPGRCIFLDENNRCKIHAAKPYECRMAMPCGTKDQPNWRRKVVAAWVRLWHKRGALRRGVAA
jgi:Fe-S-cluster containining protein